MTPKTVILLTILPFLGMDVWCQTDAKAEFQNILHLEGGGPGGVGSISYERKIFPNSRRQLAASIGVSTYNISDFTNKLNPDVIVPIGLKGLFGNKHKIELGLGQTISSVIHVSTSTWRPERKIDLHANCTVGYRYQEMGKRMVFRVAYTPMIEFYQRYRHWAMASVGYAF